MKLNSFPWLLITIVFVTSTWIRFGLVEQTELGFFCDAGGQALKCQIRSLVVQSFQSYSLGYFAIFLGGLALVTRAWIAGFLAAIVGAAGLLLYNWDFSAVGFLLGSLTLARTQLDDYRAEHGAG